MYNHIMTNPKVLSNQLNRLQKQQGLVAYLIFLQALVAMLGSLYFSTYGDIVKNLLARNIFPVDNGLLPCELCWYGRILMYPFVAVSLIGMMKEDRHFTDYILPLSTIGIGLGAFHYVLQKLNIANPFGCTLTNPCNALQVQYFGFITLPYLEMIAFIVITILCLVNMRLNRKVTALKKES